jgi:hypothetical protein
MPNPGMHDFYAEDANDTPQDLSGLYGEELKQQKAAEGGADENPKYRGTPGVQSNALLLTHADKFRSNDMTYGEDSGYHVPLETNNVPTAGLALKSMTENAGTKRQSSQRFLGMADMSDGDMQQMYGMTANDNPMGYGSSRHAGGGGGGGGNEFAASDEEDEGNNLSNEGHHSKRVYAKHPKHPATVKAHQQHESSEETGDEYYNYASHHHSGHGRGHPSGKRSWRGSTIASIGILFAVLIFIVMAAKKN